MFKVHRITPKLNTKQANKNPNSGRFSTSKSRLLLTTALVGGLSVGITAAFAGDPVFIESTESVTHTNTDAINAISHFDNAIDISSTENITVTNSGVLSSSETMGMWIAAGGATDVSNSADITSKEEAINLFGFDSAKLSNDGDLSNTRLSGISVGSFGDTVVENSGSINATEGISAFSTAGAAAFSDFGLNNTSTSDGGDVTIENEGDITLNVELNEQTITSQGVIGTHQGVGILGLATNGLTLSNQHDSDTIATPLETNPDGLNVTIANSGNIADASIVVGPTSTSLGIGAGALGDVSIHNEGDISVGEVGIAAMAGGEISATNTGEITLSYGSAGISLSTDDVLPDEDGGNITLNNSGKITAGNSGEITAGNSEEGIDVESRGTATVTNSGDIHGGYNVGIQVEAAGAVNLTNSGKIETTEYYADGIVGSSEASLTITNSGEIIADDAGIRSGGFDAITITNQKDGNLHGGNVGIDSEGGAATTIINAGKIEADESGINAVAFGGTTEYTEKDDNGNQTKKSLTVSGGKVDITNSGTITLVTPNSTDETFYELDGHSLGVAKNVAIFAVSQNGGAVVDKYYDESGQLVEDREEFTPAADDVANNAVSVTNSGTIDGTDTNYSHGILAMASDGVEIDNSGNISVGASAIYVRGNSPVTIENSGTIKVNGEFGAHGVQATSGHFGNGTLGEDISVTNSGSIDLTGAGDDRRAINAWSNGGTSTVTNSGSVITTADGARGIHTSSGGESLCDFDENNNCTLTPSVNGGTVTINSSGSVSTEGDDARAISSWSHGGAINIKTSGTLTTEGDYSRGIQAQSGETGGGNNQIVAKKGGAITIDNTAVIETEGTQAYGINGFSNGGTVDVINAGEITTAGEKANGIAINSGNSWLGSGGEKQIGGAVSLTNKAGGDITTAGYKAHAIQVGSTGGAVTIANNADLSTAGELAGGISAYSGSNRGGDDKALFVGGAVSVNNTGEIATTGLTAMGLEVWSNGGTSIVENSGKVSTAKNNSTGIGVYSGTRNTKDGRIVQAGGNVSLKNSAAVSTTGASSDGLVAYTYGGQVQVDLLAGNSVLTTGNDSNALSVASGVSSTEDDSVIADGGDIVANLGGALTTTGDESNAAGFWTNGGNITIATAANTKLTTDGVNSLGIKAHTGETYYTNGYEAHDGGTITISNAAEIETGGEESRGIEAFSNGGAVTFTNEAAISTSGEESDAVNLRSADSWIGGGKKAQDGGPVTLTNKVGGDITTTSKNSRGLQAASSNGVVTIVNAASVSTTGDNSQGIFGYSGSNRKNSNQVDYIGGDVSVSNSGNVSTKGAASTGLAVSSHGSKAVAENNGTISTIGLGSNGIQVTSGTSHTEDGRVIQVGSEITANNSGSISTTGDKANGISAYTNGGSLLLDLASGSAISTKGDEAQGLNLSSGSPRNDGYNVAQAGADIIANLNGTIATSGADAAAVGISSNGGKVTVTNDATVTTSGTDSYGLRVGSGSRSYEARDGDLVVVNNNADIIVTGTDSDAILAYSQNGKVELNNKAVVSSSSGKALVIGAQATIENSGSLIGGATLGDSADTLTNSGKLEGNFDFGGGDDALSLNAGSVFKDADFDGGTGTDTASLSGGGILASSFDNFETGTLADGSWTMSGTTGGFNTFNVSDTVELDLNSGILGAAQVNLKSGSKLIGSGKITGGLTNNGSILLTSTDTLKIEGDFHSASGSTLEFALGGSDGSTHSKLEVTDGKFTFDSSDVFNIAVDANTDLAEDSRYKVATADGGVDDLATSSDAAAVKINDSSAAFAFDRTIEGNAVWITARATISDAVAELAPELAQQASAVEEFVVESGAGGALAEQLSGLNETQLVAAVAELTTPNEAAGQQSLNSTVSTANNIVDNRIAGRISGSSQRNFYTGNPNSDPNTQNSYRAGTGQSEASKVVMAYGGEGIVGSRWLDQGGYTQAWAQVFWGNSTIEKSKSNQYGTSVGIDFRPDQNTLIGGSFSASRTNAEATNSSLEADTYGGMVYGAKGFDSGLAFSGVIGYFLSQNTTKRQALGSIYTGSFDTNTFTLSGNISQEIDLQQDWLFTPNAGVRYSHATFDSYTETGAPAPLTVSRDDVDSIELSAEASFTHNFNFTDTTKGLFEFHFGGLYEAGDNDSAVGYRFSPTGSMLYSNSEVARLKFNVGTLVEIPFSDQVSSEFAYEGTFADEYADHLLRAKFKLKF